AIEKGLYKEYVIDLQIEGQMENIIKFVSQLEKLPTLVALKKFDFKLVSQNPPIFKGTIILSKILL
ncbi:MAG: type 4a pilus biogenesis protein PilO, partial [Candidatus Omnitrophota bacterium]|nr:type 4a pilus biogenesis protein PilO [Candidatus Omnitrophota bacterium]